MTSETKVRTKWTTTIKPGETASDILERLISKCQREKKKNSVFKTYVVREFSKENSMDIRGEEASSPLFSISNRNLLSFHENKTGTKGVYRDLCNNIEMMIGVPNLPAIAIDGKLKCRSIDEIKQRLDKFEKRAKFELKSLRDIWPDTDVTQNRSTRAAIAILKWLYNSGDGRTQQVVVKKFYDSLIERERDKLFYVRRHPKLAMLHKCNDEIILERVSHLEWMFINGNPFKKVAGTPGAISRLI